MSSYIQKLASKAVEGPQWPWKTQVRILKRCHRTIFPGVVGSVLGSTETAQKNLKYATFEGWFFIFFICKNEFFKHCSLCTKKLHSIEMNANLINDLKYVLFVFNCVCQCKSILFRQLVWLWSYPWILFKTLTPNKRWTKHRYQTNIQSLHLIGCEKIINCAYSK